MEIENAAINMQPDARELAIQFGFLEKYEFIIYEILKERVVVFWMYVGSGTYDRMYWKDEKSYISRSEVSFYDRPGHPLPLALPTYKNRKKYIAVSLVPTLAPTDIQNLKKLDIEIYHDKGQDGAFVFSF